MNKTVFRISRVVRELPVGRYSFLSSVGRLSAGSWIICFCMKDGALDTRHLIRPVAEVDDVLQARALHLYALYRLHNGARNNIFVGFELEGGYRGYLREGRLASD